jgi:hypothetical protein
MMKNWTKISLASVGLVGAGTALAIGFGSSRWKVETSESVARLKESAVASKARTVSFKDLNALPAPVARYFRFVLKVGQPVIRTARIRHAGEFNLNGKWIPFESIQHFSSAPPAFVWDAVMRMYGLVNVRVRDAYLNNRGMMRGEILSLFPVVDAHDDARLDAGALQRYLAEAVWQPTALLPSENLRWSAIDDHRALATLTDAGTTVSLEFSFNESGEVAGIFAPARFREVNGRYEPTPWAGRFRNYEQRNGMMIPIEGEVEWRLPTGDAPYWRGQVVDASYDFAR